MKRTFLFYIFISAFFSKSYSQSAFYNITTIQKIEIFFEDQRWDYLLDTAKLGKDGFIMAKWVKINGTRFDSAGVKYKGNSSYDSTYLKNPLHIELNTFRDQSYEGFKDIKLSNGYADPSMLREVMAYSILQNYIPCPQSNFAQLYINGTYIGLYSNSESINKTFCADHYYSDSGVFVKGNPKLTPSPSVKSNLKYIAGDSTGYFNYYELKSDYGWKQLQALCDTITNKPSNISSIINVDRVLWMLAFNTLLVNLDSYNGAFAQNYYLYKDQTGHFNPIVWDLNMSFGGFPFLGSSNSSLGSLSISGMQNFPAGAHSTDVYWPLIKAIYNDATYKKMYIAHLKTITNDFFTNQNYLLTYNTLKNIIDTAVLNDSRKFYSYTDFQNGLNANVSVGSYSVPGIQTLMNARVSYLQSTADFINTTPTISTVGSSQPGLDQFVTISGTISGATTAWMGYRFSPASNFTRVAMFDDGLHNDGSANDNVYATGFNLTGNHAQYYIFAENSTSGIFSPQRAEHEFHSVDLHPNPSTGQVTINEFLANNKSDVTNEFHATEDWVELYNTSNTILSLENYYLSDDVGKKTRYSFPKGTTINPHDFLIVWADEFTHGTQLHSNFKLNEEGDQLVLSNGLRQILDQYTFGIQEEDVSMARCPDGTGPFSPSSLPSYKHSNCVVGLEENNMSEDNIIVYPNPANKYFIIKNVSGSNETVKIMSAVGQTIFENTFRDELRLETTGWKNGLYIVTCGVHSKKLIITN